MTGVGPKGNLSESLSKISSAVENAFILKCLHNSRTAEATNFKLGLFYGLIEERKTIQIQRKSLQHFSSYE